MGRPKKGESRSVQVNCSQCGATLKRMMGQMKCREVFCNRECQGKFMTGRPAQMGPESRAAWRIRMKGENNPNWNGGEAQSKIKAKQWRKDNREICRRIAVARRARKRGAPGSYSLQEWLDLKKRYGFRCLGCGLPEPEIKLTVDHIIPLSKGGWNSIDNIQPLCLSCNCKKKDKLVVEITDSEKAERVRLAIEKAAARPKKKRAKRTPEHNANSYASRHAEFVSKNIPVEVIMAAKGKETSRDVAAKYGICKATVLDMWNGYGRWGGNERPRERKPAHGAYNKNSKLSESQVLDIRRRLAAGESRASLQVEFKVVKSTIRAIAIGTLWGWLVEEPDT